MNMVPFQMIGNSVEAWEQGFSIKAEDIQFNKHP